MTTRQTDAIDTFLDEAALDWMAPDVRYMECAGCKTVTRHSAVCGNWFCDNGCGTRGVKIPSGEADPC